MAEPERLEFRGDGVTIVADAIGPSDAQPILFLHGGGQTRASWSTAIREAARRGYRGLSADLRGHGESGWSADGVYDHDRFVADIRHVIDRLGRAPILVGASLGGMIAMIVTAEPPPAIPALVLVDITPKIDLAGAAEIGDFMTSAPDGFANLDEAADAVAAYLPHRPRPASNRGLLKNLRLRDDGRYHWHWDPAFISPPEGGIRQAAAERMAGLEEKAAQITAPVLLVRGARSRIVNEENVRDFLRVVPHAEHVDVAGAHHMVAGDANDAFSEAVFDFVARTAR